MEISSTSMSIPPESDPVHHIENQRRLQLLLAWARRSAVAQLSLAVGPAHTEAAETRRGRPQAHDLQGLV
jgi:hypothetical protein